MVIPKHALLFTLLSASLLAGSIEFENAPNNPTRKLPSNKNEIFSFNSILKSSMSAVVNISTSTIVQTQNSQNRLLNDPFFQEFFNNYGQQRPQAPSQKKQVRTHRCVC